MLLKICLFAAALCLAAAILVASYLFYGVSDELIEFCLQSHEVYAPHESMVVYQYDGGNVRLTPAWGLYTAHEQRVLAEWIATCRMGGKARFIDARTGKLLARWGDAGFVDATKGVES